MGKGTNFTRRLLLLAVQLVGITWLLVTDGRGETPAPLPPTTSKVAAVADYGRLPLHFIENRGQVDPRVRYYVRQGGGTVFFTDREVVLALPRPHLNGKDKKQARKPAVVRLQPLRAKKTAVVAQEPLPGKVNYFIGNEPHKWRTDIPTYRAVVYRELYEGIDLKYYGQGRQLEYDIIVRPGADPEQVRFAFQGVKQVKLTPAGDLALVLPDGGTLIQKKPLIYQEVAGQRVPVAGKYRLSCRGAQVTCGFAVAAYDRSQPLVIDPVLVYSTYLGGSFYDCANQVAVDAAGSVYLIGTTSSANFPVFNPYQASKKGDCDVFITKFSPAGNSLVYSTFLGGNANDNGTAIVVDREGSAYLAGSTASTDFPTHNPFLGNNQGLTDAFVAKLGPAGNALVYSTYLGGSGMDNGYGLAVDDGGCAYVCGQTYSSNFPTINPLHGYQGLGDGFVTKLNSIGNQPYYSTYLGGKYTDKATSIAVDPAGCAYVCGATNSEDFPIQNPYQTYQGNQDAFITKLHVNGNSPIYSTFLGGSQEDGAAGLTLDRAGAVYVTGHTTSRDFPLRQAYQVILKGEQDAFVTKLVPAGNDLEFSTFLGGSAIEKGYSIALDGFQAVWLTGVTNSLDFPLVNPLQAAQGGQDAFVAKLGPPGTSLEFASYLGGSNNDLGLGIAVAQDGGVQVCGRTASTDFPVYHAFQGSLQGGDEAFLVKIIPYGTTPPWPLLLLE